MTKNIIAWDLGATKCAAGLLTYDDQTDRLECRQTVTVMLADTHSLLDLISQIETGLGIESSEAAAICIGAAGHYDGAELTHQNPYPYAMPFAQVAQQQAWPAFDVIHDYASVICATFTDYVKQAANIDYLNEVAINPYERRVAFGIGTGLGLKDAVLLPNGDFWVSHNEAGHMGICWPPLAVSGDLKRHQAIMAYLAKTLGDQPISFETVLSGKGVARLYSFFYPDQPGITPAQAGALIAAGNADELCAALAWYAGLFTGTIQLCFLPQGGIYIAGGVAQHLMQIFRHPEFQAGIVASPAYLALRSEIPMMILMNNECALYGCGYYAGKRL